MSTWGESLLDLGKYMLIGAVSILLLILFTYVWWIVIPVLLIWKFGRYRGR